MLRCSRYRPAWAAALRSGRLSSLTQTSLRVDGSQQYDKPCRFVHFVAPRLRLSGPLNVTIANAAELLESPERGPEGPKRVLAGLLEAPLPISIADGVAPVREKLVDAPSFSSLI